MSLAYNGSGYLMWEGLICLQQTGKCTDEHRELVREWLENCQLDLLTAERRLHGMSLVGRDYGS